MKAPKQKHSKIKEQLKRRIVPLNINKVECAVDAETQTVTFRFNGNQTVTIPSATILEIADKIKANDIA